MKRILASLLIAFALIPSAFADFDEDDRFEIEEEWTVEDFEKERDLMIAELDFELTYYVEDQDLSSTLKAELPGLRSLEEDAFFDKVDELYEQIDAHYESMGWFDDEDEWEDEEWEGDWDEEDDEFDGMMDEQALVELITQVIMQLKAQGLI